MIHILKEEFAILQQFKDMNPWSGNIETRKVKFLWLHQQWNRIHHKSWKLIFDIPNSFTRWFFSGSSNCSYHTRIITLRGRLSVITFLHEWGHTLGLNQTDAQLYATTLFKRVFPKKMINLHRYSDSLIKNKEKLFGGR